MLEVIILSILWKQIGRAARHKGQPAIHYQTKLLLFWFGGEIIGAGVGMPLILLLDQKFAECALFIYITAFAGAIAGAMRAFRIVSNLPDLNAKEEVGSSSALTEDNTRWEAIAGHKPPSPDGITPGKPPKFPKEVIYAGPPAAQPMVKPIAIEGMPEPAGKAGKASSGQAAGKVALPHRSEFAVFFCWLAGSILIVVVGWGFIALCVYFAKSWHLKLSLVQIIAVASVPSFLFLFLLERNLWLSRFMGLRLDLGSTQMGETLFFWLFSVFVLFVRSSDQPSTGPKSPTETDGVREIVETVVFVVVLVLMLKTFLVEAFVIPTGSMAETLWGYQKSCICEKCHRPFVINCSSEAEPPPGQKKGSPVYGGYCPNCRHLNMFPRPMFNPGMNPP